MRKILIAMRSKTAKKCLKNAFRDNWKVYTESDGAAVCDKLTDIRPEALILDLRLPHKDGLQVLEAVFPNLPPIVLVLTDYTSPYILQTLTSFGVECMLLVPFCTDYIRRLIDDMYEFRISPPTKTARHLKTLGVDPRLTGHRCLVTAIGHLSSDPDRLLKEIYPETAAECGLSDARCVERTIRTAIQKAWLKRNLRIWTYYFPTNESGDVDLPTNKQFISAIAKHI